MHAVSRRRYILSACIEVCGLGQRLNRRSSCLRHLTRCDTASFSILSIPRCEAGVPDTYVYTATCVRPTRFSGVGVLRHSCWLQLVSPANCTPFMLCGKPVREQVAPCSRSAVVYGHLSPLGAVRGAQRRVQPCAASRAPSCPSARGVARDV